MSTISITDRRSKFEQSEVSVPPLENGDHLDQKTFHERYEAMPEGFRAELIGGIVYVSSPLKRPHGRHHSKITSWLSQYEDATPGVETLDNATAILDEDAEVQPDDMLIIDPEHGGQMRMNEDEYLEGAPELAVEVASSSATIDLHGKKRDYERAGVIEYVVVVLRQKKVAWFRRRGGRLVEMAPGPDGVYRSKVFPGLWLDPEALLRRDGKRVREVLDQGLATSEHAAFVAKLGRRA